MFRLFILLTTILAGALRAVLRSRSDLVFENIPLRQKVEALKRRRPRPRRGDADRAFWLAMRSAWRGWAARLVLVQPDTVVRWHRDRFRRHWRTLSRNNPSPGRPRVDSVVRELDPEADP
jgi:putative transposase